MPCAPTCLNIWGVDYTKTCFVLSQQHTVGTQHGTRTKQKQLTFGTSSIYKNHDAVLLKRSKSDDVGAPFSQAAASSGCCGRCSAVLSMTASSSDALSLFCSACRSTQTYTVCGTVNEHRLSRWLMILNGDGTCVNEVGRRLIPVARNYRS